MDTDNNTLHAEEQELLQSIIDKAKSDGAIPNLMRTLKGHIQDQSFTVKDMTAYIHICNSLNQIASQNNEITISQREMDFLQHTLPSKIALARDYLINADHTPQDASLYYNQSSKSLRDSQERLSSQDSIESDGSLKGRTIPDTLDRNSMTSDGDRSSDSDFSGLGIPLPSTQRTLSERKKKLLDEQKLRGSHRTYSRQMFPEFRHEIKNNQYIIASDAKLTRPKNVTGSLPSHIDGVKISSEGDHLIAASWKLREIANLVRGKEASEAVEALFYANASNTAYIDDSLLEKAKTYFPTDSASNEASTTYPDLMERHKDFRNIVENVATNPAQFMNEAKREELHSKVSVDKAALEQEQKSREAFEFLKQEFIPKLYAAWNQRDNAAFLKPDSKNQSNTNSSSIDGKTSDKAEGSKINSALKEFVAIEDRSSSESIKAYIKLVDYKVVSDKVAGESQHASQRTNKIEVLIETLNDITQDYLDAYYRQIEHYDKVAKAIINEALDQGGWYEHFKQDAGRRNLEDFFCSAAQNINYDHDNIVESFFNRIKHRNPIAFEEIETVHNSALSSNTSITSSQSNPISTEISSDAESAKSRSRSSSSISMNVDDIPGVSGSQDISSDTPHSKRDLEDLTPPETSPLKKPRQDTTKVSDADNLDSQVSSASRVSQIRRTFQKQEQCTEYPNTRSKARAQSQSINSLGGPS